MIGKLTGLLDSIRDDFLILDVSGVGFKIYCSSRTLDTMPAIGEKTSLLIETVVKEDSLTLFGFLNQNEQACFNTLCRVNGIGNRVALKIMGAASVDNILLAIIGENRNIFCEIPGIGPKLAARIVTELQNCAMVKDFVPTGSFGSAEATMNPSALEATLVRDAIGALEGLGYQRNIVTTLVISIVSQNPTLTLESIITESLRKINNF
ncbi:MAG: Holliday junction branch migration protein RuvA [Rickettsiales bacterium]|jgi:Holliday junction DNA helicase RuvA|nr:Holliday junction branch migration protein RuvA [Rickettsiales bacterium]